MAEAEFRECAYCNRWMVLERSRCDPCEKKHADYRRKNREEINRKSRERYRHNKEYRERILEATRRRHEQFRSDPVLWDKERDRLRKFRLENPHKFVEWSARKRTIRKQATPPWANQKYISLFYKFAQMESDRTGRKVVVDHIIPISSPKVCGLHCEFNLQFLFDEDNRAKSNKFFVV